MSRTVFATADAVKLVLAAIESGQAKLIGAKSNSGDSVNRAKARGEVDAAYLVSLLSHLQAEPNVTSTDTTVKD